MRPALSHGAAIAAPQAVVWIEEVPMCVCVADRVDTAVILRCRRADNQPAVAVAHEACPTPICYKTSKAQEYSQDALAPALNERQLLEGSSARNRIDKLITAWRKPTKGANYEACRIMGVVTPQLPKLRELGSCEIRYAFLLAGVQTWPKPGLRGHRKALSFLHLQCNFHIHYYCTWIL